MLKKIAAFTFLAATLYAFPSAASIEEYVAGIQQDVDNILKKDNWDLFVPVNTWHNRKMYDKEKTDSYNEMPWGMGVGKHVYQDNIMRGLYVMAFSDSHGKFEPIVGYLRQWNYYLDSDKDFSVGAGYTLGVTFRDDYNYLPIPAPLPVFGIQYGKLSVQATYIPGPYNMFNVLFTWIRFEF